MSGTAKNFTALTVNLDKESRPRTIDNFEDKGPYRPADFRAWANDQLVPPDKDSADYPFYGLSRRVKLFIASRACAARGLDALSRKLFQDAKAAEDTYRDYGLSGFADKLKIEIASHAYQSAIGDFADPKLDRKQLLAEFVSCSRIYPVGRIPADLRDETDLLRKMIAEDEKHTQYSQKQLASLPQEQRIAELVYRLRDQTGFQNDVPGSIDYVDEWHELDADHCPVAELLRIGMAAVPNLIEAISDPSITRAVGFDHFGLSSELSTVSDAARYALDRITYQSFYAQGRTPEDRIVASTALARKWWEQNHFKSDEQFLAQNVEEGGYEAGTVAELLAKKYPDHALQSIAKGIANAAPNVDVGNLVWAARLIKTPESWNFAREQMLLGKTIPACLAGARLVALRDPDEAVRAVIGMQQRMLHSSTFGVEGQWENFLAGSGRVSAMKALLASVGSSAEEQSGVVNALGGRYDSSEGIFPRAASQPKLQSERRETQRLAEDFLVSKLEDKTRLGGSYFGVSVSISDMRLCDFAAISLNARFPDRYHYRPVGSVMQRDRQTLGCLNIWRVRHGLSTLSPPPRHVISLSEAEMKPFIESFITAPNPPTRAAAERQIIQLGLPALSSVLRSAKRHPTLEPVAALLAEIVDRVEIYGTPPVYASEVVHKAKSLQGAALTREALTDLLESITRSCRKRGGQQLLIDATREEDGQGYLLTLSFQRGLSLASFDDSWQTGITLMAGDEDILSSGGTSGSPNILSYVDDHSRVRKVLFNSPPLTSIHLTLQLTPY